MKNRIMFTLALLAAVGSNVYAQRHEHDWQCSAVKSRMGQMSHAAKPTVAHVDEDKYDVKYVKLDLAMNNTSTTISGNVITTAEVVSTTLGAYVFELLPPLVVDSVFIDGMPQSVVTTGDTCTVAFATPRAAGSTFTAQVYYHGTPVSGTSSDIHGISTLQSPSWGNWVTFTLSEPYSAKDWWPCKQSLTDKIDSADIWLTVPDSLKAGSNGILQAVTPMGSGRNRYEWKERYPIDYYLISAAVGKYRDYSYYMHFNGSVDSMLVQNYIYDNPTVLSVFKSVIDSTAQQLNLFSDLFGRYPFWKEKYGHAMAPLSGGMEHQTMTTLGFFQSWLVAHELGHQWFGDNVTCASWKDIVVNEGFASYSEYLYLDRFRGRVAATADMVDRQDNVMSQAGGAIYVDDTTSEGRIFSNRLSYDKGACVVHTMRHLINNDSFFFNVLRGWQYDKRYNTGTIADLRELTKSMLTPIVNGVSVDTFFQQWFYKEGFPIYSIKWNQVGNDVYVKLNQTTSVPGSVSVFHLPLELKLTSATGDTVVRVVNDAASQLYHFTWNKTMAFLSPDPNNWLTDSVSSVTRDLTMGVDELGMANITIQPNPAATTWSVAGVPAGAAMQLTDMTGKVIWQSEAMNTGVVTVPARNLSSGLYLLRIGTAQGMERVYKLVRE
jgi:aminopeptidase N